MTKQNRTQKRRQTKYVQSGGMHGTPLPMEYFGIDSGRYFETGSPELGSMKTSVNLEPMAKVCNTQTGGMLGTPLPSEYFGVDSGRYFEAGSPELGSMDTSVNLEPSAKICKSSQTGGQRGTFDYIVNPATGRSVSIFGKQGKDVLQKYLKYFN